MRDADVRRALLRRIAREHAGDPETIIVEEMGVWSGSARIDVAVVNSELHGFEIKSEHDTLARLAAQVRMYGLVFDRVTLVVAERHLGKAKAAVPRWWGIEVVSPGADGPLFGTERRAGLNPAPDPVMIARLLWRCEAVEVLAKHDDAKGWRSASAERLHRRLAEALPLDVLRAEVRDRLRRRAGEWSRKIRPYALDVTADADGDPRLEIAG